LSRSESPDMPVEDQHSLMRSVVGVLSEEERNEIEKNAKLNKEKETTIAEVPILQRQAQTDHQRLEASFGRALPTPDDPLLVQNVRTELSGALSKTESDIRELDTDAELLRLQDAHESAIKKTTEVVTEIRILDRQIGELNTKLQMHELKKTKKGAQDFAASLAPGVGYCRVPIEEAKEKGCTLAFDQPRDLASEKVLQSIVNLGAEIQNDIENLMLRKKSLDELLTKSRKEEGSASKQLMQYRTRLSKKRNELYNQRSEFLDRIKLAQRANDAWRKADELARRIEKLDADILGSRSKQAKYRERTKKAVNDLALIYEEIVRAVLGNSVSGAIELSGRDFTCKIERNGDVSSGAIDTIKILAFDLAALASSVSGQGDHPRFLLHDSPREADMAPLTYKRLFLWALKLEEAFESQPSNFQYIITTTEAPPEDLQTDPWLLDPVLDASLPEKRLLGVDL
ncbi:MAG: hypothetical protein LC775_05135, partial [Acidobacteria bacterium]|nr:hypothetical protein [Acidobacteriota bacterium]